MTTIKLWSFSPLSGPAPRGPRFRGELPGGALLGGEGRMLPGSGGRYPGCVSRLLRLLRILARRRRRRERGR